MMLLELLAASFILGMCITAVVLAAISAADALVRTKHTNAAERPTDVAAFGRTLNVLRSRRGHANSGQRRAA